MNTLKNIAGMFQNIPFAAGYHLLQVFLAISFNFRLRLKCFLFTSFESILFDVLYHRSEYSVAVAYSSLSCTEFPVSAVEVMRNSDVLVGHLIPLHFPVSIVLRFSYTAS